MNVSDERIERVALAILARRKGAWDDRDLARAALEADAPALEAARVEGMREGLKIAGGLVWDERATATECNAPVALLALAAVNKAIDARISALRGKEE